MRVLLSLLLVIAGALALLIFTQQDDSRAAEVHADREDGLAAVPGLDADSESSDEESRTTIAEPASDEEGASDEEKAKEEEPLEVGVVRLSVVDSNRRPIEGATASFSVMWSEFYDPDDYEDNVLALMQTENKSDAEGQIELEVPAEWDDLFIDVGGSLWCQQSLPLTSLLENEERELGTITLIAGHDLEGRLSKESGDAAAGFQIQLIPPESPSTRWAHWYLDNPGRSKTPTAVTDEEGRWQIRGIPTGKYRVFVLGPGHPGVVLTTLDLRLPYKKHEQDLLLRGGDEVHGRVVDEQGNPIPDCNVLLEDRDESYFGVSYDELPSHLRSFRSDEEGRFQIPGLFPGERFELSVYPAGYIRANRSFHVGQPVELVVRKSGQLKGIVRNHKGEPVKHATVALAQEGKKRVRIRSYNYTDEEGRFEIQNTAPGAYQLLAKAPNGPSAEPFDVIVTTEEPEEIEIELPKGSAVTVRVLHDGRPPVLPEDEQINVNCNLITRDSIERFRSRYGARVDENGVATFYGLKAGEWEFGAWCPSFRGIEHTETILGGVEHEITLSLESTGNLHLTVVDSFGEPASGIDIALYPLDQERQGVILSDTSWGESTDSAGRISWGNLKTGSYRLEPGLGPFDDRDWDESGPQNHPDGIVVAIEAGKTFERTMTVRTTNRLTVNVLRGGQPQAYSVGHLSTDSGSTFAQAGPEGSIRFYGAPAGEARLGVAPFPGGPMRWEDLLLQSGLQEITVSLPTGAIRGWITLDGLAVRGANVELLAADDNSRIAGSDSRAGRLPGAGDEDRVHPMVMSEPDGRFNMAAVSPGSWQLRAYARGSLATTIGPFDHEGEAVLDVGEIALRPAASMKLSLIGPDQEPVTIEGLLQLHRLDDPDWPAVRLFPQGTIECDHLPAGRYRITLDEEPLGADFDLQLGENELTRAL